MNVNAPMRLFPLARPARAPLLAGALAALFPVVAAFAGTFPRPLASRSLFDGAPRFELAAQATCPRAAGPDGEAGWTSYRAGDMEGARARFEAALARCPEDPYASTGLGYVELREGETEQAIVRFEAVLEAEPDNVDAFVGMGLARWRTGELERARDRFERALALEPTYTTALEWLERVRGALERRAGDPAGGAASGPAGSITSAVPGAGELARSGRYDASIAAYRARLEDDRDDVEARLGLARVLGWRGDYEASIAQYDRVLDAHPYEPAALVGKARTLGWAGRLVEAEEVARLTVDVDEGLADAWLVLARILEWQERAAAALDAVQRAAALAPDRTDVQDRLGALRRAFRPRTRAALTVEDDSDGNRMVTARLTSTWHPTPRIRVRAEAYDRDVEQELAGPAELERAAFGVEVGGRWTIEPGWDVSVSAGGTSTTRSGDPTFAEVRMSLASPARRPLRLSLEGASTALTGTAALTDRGVRWTRVLATGRWEPAPQWRIDGNVGLGVFEGSEDNGRRSAVLAAARRFGSLSLGTGLRGFSFEKDLDDGYFDPEFFGIWEATGSWLARPGPWTFVVEVAPGVQLVERASEEGDSQGAVRSNARAGYGFGPGREISAAFTFSSAGVGRLSPGDDESYEYVAFTLSLDWAF